MADSDRIRWDQRYSEGGVSQGAVPAWLGEMEDELPRQGRALDIAAGSGRLALWLADRGLETVAVDISSVGLELVRQAVQAAGLQIVTIQADLEAEPLPDGPFDLISCFRYRQRDLFPFIRERLRPGGILIADVATVTNLERHPHPSMKYLAETNELLRDCAPLEIVYYWEGWFEDHASARVIARK
ncbi:MAG: class I SAM-dependent methyltransferase [Dehalococcoidia bacterium]